MFHVERRLTLAGKIVFGPEVTADEETEIENDRQVGCLIELLKSKSR